MVCSRPCRVCSPVVRPKGALVPAAVITSGPEVFAGPDRGWSLGLRPPRGPCRHLVPAAIDGPSQPWPSRSRGAGFRNKTGWVAIRLNIHNLPSLWDETPRIIIALWGARSLPRQRKPSPRSRSVPRESCHNAKNFSAPRLPEDRQYIHAGLSQQE